MASRFSFVCPAMTLMRVAKLNILLSSHNLDFQLLLLCMHWSSFVGLPFGIVLYAYACQRNRSDQFCIVDFELVSIVNGTLAEELT